MNNVKNSIGWADWTWNPVSGCRRSPPCSYCYARRIHERFNKTPFSDVVFHPERLDEPLKVKKPSTIFVGSMSDIEYWPRYVTRQIMEVAARCPQHTFMFLSKSSKSYDFIWPFNTMQGLTVTKVGKKDDAVIDMFMCPRPFLSIEPLLGYVGPANYEPFERVIVGAMTGPGAVKPKREWIESIKRNVPKEKLYWKANIREAL